MGLELDEAIAIVGLPRFGKTTIARGILKRHLTRFPTGRAFVHDPKHQFADVARYYPSTSAWRAAAAAAAKRKEAFPRVAAFGGEVKASDITRLCKELGERFNTAGNVRVPMLDVKDETALCDTSGPTWIDELDQVVFSTRAHLGIVPVYNMQRPAARLPDWYMQCTDVYVLSQPTPEWTSTMEKCLGLEKGTLRVLVRGGKHRYVHWRQGDGIVAEGLVVEAAA